MRRDKRIVHAQFYIVLTTTFELQKYNRSIFMYPSNLANVVTLRSHVLRGKANCFHVFVKVIC